MALHASTKSELELSPSRVPDQLVFDHVIAALAHGTGDERLITPGGPDRVARPASLTATGSVSRARRAPSGAPSIKFADKHQVAPRMQRSARWSRTIPISRKRGTSVSEIDCPGDPGTRSGSLSAGQPTLEYPQSAAGTEPAGGREPPRGCLRVATGPHQPHRPRNGTHGSWRPFCLSPW
jgi:hypothetical protein